MTKIIDSRWIPSSMNIISGKDIMNGRLEILVDKSPEFVYR